MTEKKNHNKVNFEKIYRITMITLMTLNLLASIVTGCYVLAIERETGASTEMPTEEPTEPSTAESTTEEPTETPTEASVEPTIESTGAELSTEPIDNVNDYDVEMLAMVIFQEAGADYCCDNCRRRVADIVLNRVNSDLYPNTIEAVLSEEGQYGRYAWTGIVWPSTASDPNNAHAVERARRIAREVLEGQHSEVYGQNYLGQAGFTQGMDGFWCCGIYFAKF